jgi:hypothetical protein
MTLDGKNGVVYGPEDEKQSFGPPEAVRLAWWHVTWLFTAKNERNTNKKDIPQRAIDEKDVVHPPGVEPGPIAWKAIILPLDQECLMEECVLNDLISCVQAPFWPSTVVNFDKTFKQEAENSQRSG